MTKKMILRIISFCLLFSTGCQKLKLAKENSIQKNINITVSNIARSFIVYIPESSNKTDKLPLVFVLHGGSGSAESMLKLADFRALATKEKFILVYPDGIEKSWNDGRPTSANVKGIDDVAFFSEMCDYLTENYPVSKSKIYVTGMSNGGFMASRLACELSNKIAAFAVVAGSMEANTIAVNCKPSMPVAAIYIQGTQDPLVSFNGGEMTVGAGGKILSHTQVIEKWVKLNNCTPNPTITDIPDLSNDGTSIKKRTYPNGTNGSEVVSYVVLNGGHTWPLGSQYLGENTIGKTSQDMNANEVIWEFFKRFSR
jgi:polyhydroxybutyrate depolymerase